MRRVLFLSGGENRLYDEQRNSYEGVHARRLFVSNTRLNRALRRLGNKLHPEVLGWFFDDWQTKLAEYDLVILPVSLYSRAVIDFVRKRSDVPIVNWYWNPVYTTESPESLQRPGTATFSFDTADCDQYGLNFAPTYYFGNFQLPSSPLVHDLCFIGADKGRLRSLLELKQKFDAMALRCLFHVTSADTAKPDPEYPYQPGISYQQILTHVAESTGILDFVQQGQVGLSQRPMEALFFRKKLVTNDTRIVHQDFYDPENVFVLGRDRMQDLPAWLSRPCREIDAAIRDRYDFGHWVDGVLAKMRESGLLR